MKFKKLVKAEENYWRDIVKNHIESLEEFSFQHILDAINTPEYSDTNITEEKAKKIYLLLDKFEKELSNII